MDETAETEMTTTNPTIKSLSELQDEFVRLWALSEKGDKEATRRLLQIQEDYWKGQEDLRGLYG